MFEGLSEVSLLMGLPVFSINIVLSTRVLDISAAIVVDSGRMGYFYGNC